MKLFFSILGLLLTISLTSAGRVSCYYETWSTYSPEGGMNVEDIPGDLCTHITYSFIGVNPNNWEVLLLDSGFDIDQDGFNRFTSLKQRYPGLRTNVAVGGWGEGGEKYSNMVSAPERRSSFIRSVVDLMKRYNFDGLDVDWEYPGDTSRGGRPTDKANFVQFLRELRQAFDNEGRGWEISIATAVTESTMDNGYDVPAICQIVNIVHAMTYDMHGTWDDYADVHSPLHRRPRDSGGNENLNTEGGIGLWVKKGCPANKIAVGVPFYGNSFNIGDNNNNYEEGTQSYGPGDPGPYLQAPGTLVYFEVCTLINQQGWTERWDESGMVPWAYKGHNWVGYENPRSVQAKADWIRAGGYAGAMVWAIDHDDLRGYCGERLPLINILHRTLV